MMRNMRRMRNEGLVSDLTYVFAQLSLLGVKQQVAMSRPDRPLTKRERKNLRALRRRNLRKDLRASLELIEAEKYAAAHGGQDQNQRT